MNIEAIGSFLHVAETGSFSIAAARLLVTQSTISGRIQSLEEELGCVLFRRGRSGAELTAAGHDFRPHAEQIIQTWDRARQHIALPKGFTASFHFGGPVALQDDLSIAWVLWMKDHMPNVALHLEAGYSDVLTESLAARLMDAAIMYLPRQRPGLVVEELLKEDLILVGHPERQGDWQDNFVSVNWGHEFRVDFSRTFPAMPAPTMSVGLGALGLQYVLALKGAAYLPRSLARPLLRERRLDLVAGAPVFRRPIYLVHPSESRHPELSRLALDGLRMVAAGHSAQDAT